LIGRQNSLISFTDVLCSEFAIVQGDIKDQIAAQMRRYTPAREIGTVRFRVSE